MTGRSSRAWLRGGALARYVGGQVDSVASSLYPSRPFFDPSFKEDTQSNRYVLERVIVRSASPLSPLQFTHPDSPPSFLPSFLPSPSVSPSTQYYIKPFVQRKQRYNRWVRRRSLEKINHILNKVRYEKARYVARKEGGREGGRTGWMNDADAHTPHQHFP